MVFYKCQKTVWERKFTSWEKLSSQIGVVYYLKRIYTWVQKYINDYFGIWLLITKIGYFIDMDMNIDMDIEQLGNKIRHKEKSKSESKNTNHDKVINGHC